MSTSDSQALGLLGRPRRLPIPGGDIYRRLLRLHDRRQNEGTLRSVPRETIPKKPERRKGDCLLLAEQLLDRFALLGTSGGTLRDNERCRRNEERR